MTKSLVGLGGLAVVILAVYALKEFQKADEQRFDPDVATETSREDGPRRHDDQAPILTHELDPRRDENPAENAEALSDDATRGATVTITGRVIDESGAPLSGLEVRVAEDLLKNSGFPEINRPKRLKGRVDTTVDGQFSLQLKLEPGSYRFLVPSPRHINHETTIEIAAASHYDLGTITLLTGGSISGVVRHQGRPIAGVEIRAALLSTNSGDVFARLISRGLGETTPDAVTNDHGEFKVMGLTAGPWTLSTNHDDYISVQHPPQTLVERQDLPNVSINIESGLSLKGVVRNENGEALPNAELRATSALSLFSDLDGNVGSAKEAKSDQDGRFAIHGLKPGNVNLRVKAAGYRNQVKQQIQPGADEIEVIMPPAAMIYGLARHAETQEPLTTATIERAARFSMGAESGKGARVLQGEDALALASEITDPRGLYAVSEVNTRSVILNAKAPGFGSVRSPDLNTDEVNRLRFDFELAPEAIIRGRVLDADQKPVANAELRFPSSSSVFSEMNLDVSFTSSGRRSPRDEGSIPLPPTKTTTDAEGRFEIRGIAAQSLMIQAHHAGFSPSEAQSLDLEPGSHHEVELELRPGAIIVGKVLDGDGLPAAGRRIMLEAQQIEGIDESELFNPLYTGMTKTDAQGEFEFPDLLPGDYRVKLLPNTGGLLIMGAENDDIHELVRADAGTTQEVLLQDRKTARVYGIVRAAGQPVAAATVSLSSAGSFGDLGANKVKTDERGRYELKNIATGEKRVSVTAPGSAIPTKLKIEVGTQDLPLNIDLPLGAIEGRVVDAANGKGLAAITVTIRPLKESEESTISSGTFTISFSDLGDDGSGIQTILGGGSKFRSEDDGHYHAKFLEDGDYQVEVSGGGYMTAKSETVTVQEGKVLRGVNFVLERGYTLSVKLKTSTRDSFSLTLTRLDVPDAPPQHKTSRGGTSEFRGLAPGTYRIQTARLGNMSFDEAKGPQREVVIGSSDQTIEIDVD